MEIKRGRMVHLGYGKFWRSDDIVGLVPIEDERGPGRRTEVYVSTQPDSFVASRTERAILRDMVTMAEEIFEAEEAKEILEDLHDDLSDISPPLRRLILSDANVDIGLWLRRLSALLERDREEEEDQENLFTDAH